MLTAFHIYSQDDGTIYEKYYSLPSQDLTRECLFGEVISDSRPDPNRKWNVAPGGTHRNKCPSVEAITNIYRHRQRSQFTYPEQNHFHQRYLPLPPLHTYTLTLTHSRQCYDSQPALHLHSK